MTFYLWIAPVIGAAIIIATWMLTYVAHSAIVCAGALAAGRWLVRAPRARDAIWKVALLAPLLSSTAAVIASRWSATDRSIHAPALPIDRHVAEYVTAERRNGGEVVSSHRTVDSLAVAMVFATGLLLTTGGTFAVTRLMWRRRRFMQSIRNRTMDRTLSLASGTGVTITRSSAVQAPLALGAREICLPMDGLADLSAVQRWSVVAHEVAHLDRRDPEWMWLAELLAAATVVQPLMQMVVRRLRRDAEFICDELAVDRVGDARPLVESLALLARHFDAWTTVSPAAASYVASPVVERASRLLSHRAGRASLRAVRAATAIAVVACGSLGALPVLTPAPRPPSRLTPGDGNARMIRVVDVREEVPGPAELHR